MKTNFDFLDNYWTGLACLGKTAEMYLYIDPDACICKLGLLGERLMVNLLAYEKTSVADETSYAEKIQIARRLKFLPGIIDDILYALRKGRNEAVYDSLNSLEQAKTLLHLAYRICCWFTEVYGDWNFQAEEYHEPEKIEFNADLTEHIREMETKLDTLTGTIESSSTPASKESSVKRHKKAEEAAAHIELTEYERKYLKKEQIRMDASVLSVVNLALQQNNLPFIRSIEVNNLTSQDLSEAQIRISSSPAFIIPFKKTVTLIPAESKLLLKEFKILMDAEYLAGLTERVNANLIIELFYEDKLLSTENISIKVLAFNQWMGSSYFPELLASFVTPNHPAIVPIISRSATFLEKWTGDPSLDAYFSKNTNRVLQMAAAIYKSLQEQNIVYAVPPAGFEYLGQRIRLCDEILDLKMGTCLDLSILYASCLEAIGLNPLLILLKGHAFIGLWLEENIFQECVQDDKSQLTKRIAEGSQVLAVVESTFFRAGCEANFDQARRSAEDTLKSCDDFDMFLDVHRARISNIIPLPVRIQTEEGWHIERPEVNKDLISIAPKRVLAPIDLSNAEQQEFSKKVLWERKLLNLGMRNTLLNMRMTKSMVPILSTSLDDLEDALSDGGDFTIRPRPAEWSHQNEKVEFDNLHIVGEYTDLLHTEFKKGMLRSSLTETELIDSLKILYRSSKTDMEENGANTLYLALGLLKWFATERSMQARYAPLLLVPIEMVRRSAAKGYTIRLRDDETQMNITLLEKLRQDYSIIIKGLDPLPQDDKGVDTRRVYAIIRNAIMEQRRWDVIESACLGIFSFSQFVMWNDIHNRAEDLARSKVVKSLMESHLTWMAEDMTISGRVPEDGVMLPIPADASQLFAIEAAAEGKSFVLHGPPGTGKSQTITALIANVLSKGKTVLFVAEKMAALEVVQKRLAAIGLDPFCLELHSNKAKKKDVLEQLRKASEVSKYTSSGEYKEAVSRIASLRNELDQYAAALHRQQPCGKTLYQIINEYQTYQDAPDIMGTWTTVFADPSREQLYDWDILVTALASSGKATGHPFNNPLSHIHCKDYSQQLRRSAVQIATMYKNTLSTLYEKATALSMSVNMPMDSDFDELGRIAYVARCLIRFSKYPDAWVETENAQDYLKKVLKLAEHRMNQAQYKNLLKDRWKDSFYDLDGQGLMDEFNQQAVKWPFGKMLGMKKLQKKVSTAAKGSITQQQLGQDLANLCAYQEEKRAADILYAEVGKDLESLDQGENTEWPNIIDLALSALHDADDARFISGDDTMRIKYGTSLQVIGLAKDVLSAWDEMLSAKEKLYTLLDLTSESSVSWIQEEEQICDHIIENEDHLREWILWNKAANDCIENGLEPVVSAYRNGMDSEMVIPAFRKAIYKELAIKAIDSEEVLNLFSGNSFNEKIAQFRKIDEELTELAQSEIFCKLAEQVPNFTTASISNSETGILQRAIRSGGRGISLRKLFEQIPNLLPKLCPCMLMSPISVAQYLDPNRKPFDLVVFDEASQIPTCKAIGALARGENAIIVGDPKQMPPTSFFASSTTDEDHLDEEDMESILDDCLALNMPQTHLLWHYRSRHESLIAFCNSQFYENRLYTFPSVNDRESHVHLVHVDGIFERGGRRINRAEAEAVVEELKRRCYDSSYADKSVGIVTFNISQQNLIDDLLTEACVQDPLLDEWAYNSKEPIFIKNLENVQGDERDVILFSIGYGPDKHGKVSMNFGPLNKEGGWRRLNVAISRARYEMVVFATLTPDQIDLSRTSATGVAALKEFLQFATSNQLYVTESSSTLKEKEPEGIIDAICKAIQDKGYETDRFIGESAYKIDIGVVDPKDPDKYLLGILLDGASYENAKTTRDREIAQINVLKGLGWRITRVWTMDWWDNSKREITKLLNEIEKAESEKENDSEPDHGTTDLEEQDPSIPMKGLVVADDDEKPISIYKIANLPKRYVSAEDFVKPDKKHKTEVIDKVLMVVDLEAPISENLLIRRVIQSYGITRYGNRIQRFMRGIFLSMGIKVSKQNGVTFYWSSKQNPDTYREFRAIGTEENSKRDVKDIPVQEAANAVCRALENLVSAPEEDLIRVAANLMGINRVRNTVYGLFLDAINLAKKDRRIVKTDNGNWILND